MTSFHRALLGLTIAASTLTGVCAQAASTIPMGAYLQNPGWPGSPDEVAFEAHYVQFSRAMNAAPQFLDTYVDQSQPQYSWGSNAGWLAYGLQTSPVARTMTQVVGVPLFSTYNGRGATPDPQLVAMADGHHDRALKTIVDQLVTSRTPGFAGFKTIYFRLGWEMNLNGTWYAGQDAQTQADWVRAFQRAATVIRAEAAAHGATALIVWNPGTVVWGVHNVMQVFYPGDAYVDVIAADFYADMYPSTNGSDPVSWENWDTGRAVGGQPFADTNYYNIINDPVNRAHYWAYPSANAWAPQGDTSGAYTLSLLDLLGFAESRGKPFAVAEAGAGGVAPHNDVSDDAAFPAWLGNVLLQAQQAGEPIAFVNLWDCNGTAPYVFTDGSKPQELQAFGSWFGGL